MIRLTAFQWVPDFARGLVRDLRVRWALEEAGLPYETRLIGFEDQGSAGYRAQQPFGQVPVYEEDGLTLFESGAIVLHIAGRAPGLLPVDPNAREQAVAWLFAALNTLEPPIQNLAEIDLFHAGESWVPARRPGVEAFARTRLAELAAYLEGRDYLVSNAFTAADLMMVTVLRNLRHTDLLAEQPTLTAYVARCEARPAFQTALTSQLSDFRDLAPA